MSTTDSDARTLEYPTCDALARVVRHFAVKTRLAKRSRSFPIQKGRLKFVEADVENWYARSACRCAPRTATSRHTSKEPTSLQSAATSYYIHTVKVQLLYFRYIGEL